MVDTFYPGDKAIRGLDAEAALRCELLAIERSLSAICIRIDAAGHVDTVDNGVATMALDQASHAVHLALLEVQACLATV